MFNHSKYVEQQSLSVMIFCRQKQPNVASSPEDDILPVLDKRKITEKQMVTRDVYVTKYIRRLLRIVRCRISD